MPVKPRYFSIYLPCKPYIARYVAARFGDPMPVTNKTALGCFLNACLVKERYTSRTYTDSFLHAHYTAKAHLSISEWQFVNLGFDFATDKVVELNQFIEAQFEEYMHMWVDSRMVGRAQRKQLIEEFAQRWGIEIDTHISLDGLVKTEYRTRQAILRHQSTIPASPQLFAAG